jgi:HEAT repeat protein
MPGTEKRSRSKEKPVLSKDECWPIELLENNVAHENDLSSAIDTLELLLSLDALLPLLIFMMDETHSKKLRKQAAKAISVIGNEYIETELKALLSSPSSELRLLAEIALGNNSPNAL